MRSLVAVFLLCIAAAPAAAQVISRPTDPPIVTAENDSWYRLREPVQFAGDFYYPAGATVFFDGNRMARTGHYNGVPLYADTTIEPYSIVFVPVGRGMMQPYERVRSGDLAGTSGSRPSSFPAQRAPVRREAAGSASSPTMAPQPAGAISAFTSEPGAVGTSGVAGRVDARTIVGTAGSIATPDAGAPLVSVRRAESNDGIWLDFMGEKWVSAGAAVPLQASAFVRVGERAGYPVYARQGLDEDVIYLPTRAGLLAPYKLKP
jgi:hypothetical protein